MQIYLSLDIYTHECTFYKHMTYMCAHVHICMYVYVFVCVYMCMCMPVCVCVFMYILHLDFSFWPKQQDWFKGTHAIHMSFWDISKSCLWI